MVDEGGVTASAMGGGGEGAGGGDVASGGGLKGRGRRFFIWVYGLL